jgi:hypothetical protein
MMKAVRPDCIELDRVAFIGRTFGEYRDMFGLTEEDLRRGPVLDCPAGPSSFAAEARAMGVEATACDVLYGLSIEELVKKGKGDISYIYEKLKEAAHLYTWEYYKDKDDVIALRNRALKTFSDDFKAGRREGRYVEAALPRLPFPDGAFSLVLSGHFLFLYGDRMDYDFHLASLREMLRVCSGEARVFPLQGLDAKQSPYLKRAIETLEREGVATEMVQVPLEFQRGGNMMLRLRHNNI